MQRPDHGHMQHLARAASALQPYLIPLFAQAKKGDKMEKGWAAECGFSLFMHDQGCISRQETWNRDTRGLVPHGGRVARPGISWLWANDTSWGQFWCFLPQSCFMPSDVVLQGAKPAVLLGESCFGRLAESLQRSGMAAQDYLHSGVCGKTCFQAWKAAVTTKHALPKLWRSVPGNAWAIQA